MPDEGRGRRLALAGAAFPWLLGGIVGLTLSLLGVRPGEVAAALLVVLMYLGSAILGVVAARSLERSAVFWGVMAGLFAGLPLFVLAYLGVNKDFAAAVTPLWCAARAGDLEECRRQLEAGADPRRQVARRSAIEIARRKGHADVARLLEAADGVDRSFGERDDGAVADGLLACREAGLDTAALASVLLVRAARDGYAEIVRTLVRRGADPDGRAGRGRTPLTEAIARGHSMVALELLEVGASVDQRDALGDSPLLVAAQTGCAALVAPLVSAGAAIEGADAAGLTPLARAVRGGDVATVEELLAVGANPNATDHDGRTSLEMAVFKGHAAIEKVLLDCGALRNAAYEKMVAGRQIEEKRRRAAEEERAAARQREEERRVHQLEEEEQRREERRLSAREYGGHQKCSRCAAGRTWALRQTLEKAARRGMDVVVVGDLGVAPSRPADYAGSCPGCRDFFCREHAEGDHCAICGSSLTY